MTAEPTEARPTAAWMQVLDFIEDALARRLAEVREPPAPVSDAGRSAKAPLQALDDRLSRIQARLEQAERDAAEADLAPGAESEVYQRWTERMTAARRRMGDWAANVR